MVALPFPAFDQRRPFGNAEWKSKGTGWPTAVTLKETDDRRSPSPWRRW